jgi:hypothetical protein
MLLRNGLSSTSTSSCEGMPEGRGAALKNCSSAGFLSSPLKLWDSGDFSRPSACASLGLRPSHLLRGLPIEISLTLQFGIWPTQVSILANCMDAVARTRVETKGPMTEAVVLAQPAARCGRRFERRSEIPMDVLWLHMIDREAVVTLIRSALADQAIYAAEFQLVHIAGACRARARRCAEPRECHRPFAACQKLADRGRRDREAKDRECAIPSPLDRPVLRLQLVHNSIWRAVVIKSVFVSLRVSAAA